MLLLECNANSRDPHNTTVLNGQHQGHLAENQFLLARLHLGGLTASATVTSGLSLGVGYQASRDQWVKEGPAALQLDMGVGTEPGERPKSQTWCRRTQNREGAIQRREAQPPARKTTEATRCGHSKVTDYVGLAVEREPWSQRK